MTQTSAPANQPQNELVPAKGLAAALLLLTACLTGCGVPGADGPADSFGLDFQNADRSGERGTLVFLVDGVSAEVFREMLDANELPALKKYFVDRGLYAPRTVANLPSVTLANLTSVTTGMFPGHHGVLGVNWFDRNRLVWRNYETIAQKNTLDGDYISKTVYEYFPGRSTYSLFFQPHRGVTKFFENWTSAGPPFYFGMYELVDRIALYRLGEMADLARARGRWPAVTIAYNLSPDFYSYKYGADSIEYRDAIRHTDRQIGRVLGDLDRAGILKNLYIMLISDHGHTEVTRHLPMDDFARENLGLDVAYQHLWEETDFAKRLTYYQKYQAVLYGSGDRYWAFCLRKPLRDASGKLTGFAAWTRRPDPDDLLNYPATGKDETGETTVDIPAKLVAQQAVDVAAWSTGPNRVRLRRATGEVEFAQPAGPGGEITCRTVAGTDPLGWKSKLPADALAGKPYSPRQWLNMTLDTDYPDAPAQLLAYFRGRRAGDVVAFAASEWDFGKSNCGGHGGLRPADMFVPLLIAGPGVPKATLPVARSVDLVPTILDLMGKPVPPGLDGQSLVEIKAP